MKGSLDSQAVLKPAAPIVVVDVDLAYPFEAENEEQAKALKEAIELLRHEAKVIRKEPKP